MCLRIYILALFCGALLVGCNSNSGESANGIQPVNDSRIRFGNVHPASVEYIGDASCSTCHADEYAGFQTHGMAKSFAPMTAVQRSELFDSVPIYHEQSDFYYQAVAADSGYYQDEYRLDEAGQKTHFMRWTMEYVVGSGGAAQTYLGSDNGRLFELPLTWYTQTQRWDFSPGYDVRNARFDRLIPDRCIACHNGYPEDIPNLEGKYISLPNGIGCERCHGPGSLHVDERLSNGDPETSIDTTIVNPKHLSLDKRLDVCQQCHLNGSIDVLREGRSAFDFMPSESLSEHRAMFESAELSESGIKVISHADRMKQSECFLQTLDSPSPLECTTCHNPHEGFRDKDYTYFTSTCLSCHSIPELTAQRPQEFVSTHSVDANCIACHMPRQEATDVPHASFTDHYIRVIADNLDQEATEIPSVISSRDAVMVPLFEVDRGSVSGDMYRGMAMIAFGKQQGDSESIAEGIQLIEKSKEVGTSSLEAEFMTGLGYLFLGEVTDSIGPLENVVRTDPNDPEKLNALAQAYEADGRSRLAIEKLYRRSLTVQPMAADVRLNYGRYLLSIGDVSSSISEFKKVILERPRYSDGYYNLGTAQLQSGNTTDALVNLHRALNLDPDNQEALGNLGFLHATSESNDSARVYFERAMSVDESNHTALGNLGAFYLNQGDRDDAIRVLLQAVEIEPDFADALANISLAYFQNDEYAKARTYGARALDVDAGQPLARQIMEALAE